ncbi:MAG: flagellar hook protein FlgE [Gemmatimonadota bacterium]
MMRALFAGVSGLRNHQTALDVIGNNIANVNTVGFKASRVTFKEAFVQMLEGASRPGASGGKNPLQIGSGMSLGSVDQMYTQGNFETTGQTFDLAIQGDSLFVLNSGSGTAYTRAGNLTLDATGRLVAESNGFAVQGRMADATGAFPSSAGIGDIIIPFGQASPGQATGTVTMTGNLDQATPVGGTHAMTITTYDSAGAAHDLSVTMTNTGPGAWSWSATSGSATVTPAGTGTVTFNPDGSLAAFTYPGAGAGLTLTPTAGAPYTVTIGSGTVGAFDGLTGFASASNAVSSGQNGYPSGELDSLTVDSTGVITGSFTNGITRSLAQVALATFNNPGGLNRIGDTMYGESPNSGLPITGFAGSTNNSSITAGALESSNVDISQEFTNMIIAQRGFQANARVITTADEMLTELVNLKR